MNFPFIFNFFRSMKWGEKVDSNPWHATTLEWAATTSPPLDHGNFEVLPVVYRGPYEYSVPGEAADFIPQNVPQTQPAVPAPPVSPIPAAAAP